MSLPHWLHTPPAEKKDLPRGARGWEMREIRWRRTLAGPGSTGPVGLYGNSMTKFLVLVAPNDLAGAMRSLHVVTASGPDLPRLPTEGVPAGHVSVLVRAVA